MSLELRPKISGKILAGRLPVPLLSANVGLCRGSKLLSPMLTTRLHIPFSAPNSEFVIFYHFLRRVVTSVFKMVYYFTSTTVDPPAYVYVGKDKFESKYMAVRLIKT